MCNSLTARTPLAFFLFLAAVAFAFAQDPPAEQAIRVGVNVVRVPVWVVNAQGRPVGDLQQSDFRILENGKEQKVALFDRGLDPVHVALIVDTSHSTAPFLDGLVEAARQFSQRFGAEDRLAVYEAGPQVVRIQGFTNRREALLDALRDFKTAEGATSRSARRSKDRAVLKQNTGRGGTLLYDAIMLVRREFPEAAGRRVIILFTDGWDSGSDTEFKNVRNAILLGNEQIFSVLANAAQQVPAAVPPIPLVPERPSARPPEKWALVFDTLTLSSETFEHYERAAKTFLAELPEADLLWLFSFEQALTPVFIPPAKLNADGSLAAMRPAEALPALPQMRLAAAARPASQASTQTVLPDRVLFLTEEGSLGPREFMRKARPKPGSYVFLAPEEMTDEQEMRAALRTLIHDAEGTRKLREHVAVARHAMLQSRLPQLALDSGGTLFPMQTSQQLEGIYQQIADQIRSSYSLGYYTEAAAGRHVLEVSVKDRSARVHARRAVLVK